MTVHLLRTETITLRRFGAVTRAKGRVSKPTPTTSPIYANVQPAVGKDIERLPEGMRSHESIHIWTETELKVADEAAGLPPDEVTWQGGTYQVGNVREWQDLHVKHYDAVAAKQEPA